MLSAAQRKILAQFASRHGRKKSPYFLAEGLRCCREARLRHPDWLAFTVATEAFLASPDGEAFADDGHVAIVSESEFAALTETSTPQGVLMVLHRPPAVPPERLPSPWCLILDRLQEPGNLGTILRTADALGMDSVVLTGECADVYNPKTVRATMGAVFRQRFLRLERGELLAWLHGHGMRLYGAALSERACDLRKVDLGCAAVAIGSEGQGLSAELLEMCDGELIIPMRARCESLNAAVAAAIVMWELTK